MRTQWLWEISIAIITFASITILGTADASLLPTGTVTAITAVGGEVTTPDGNHTTATLRGGAQQGDHVALVRNPDGTWYASPTQPASPWPTIIFAAAAAAAAAYITRRLRPNQPHPTSQQTAAATLKFCR